MPDWWNVATPLAVLVLAVLMFFRDRIVQRPNASAEHQLVETYKNMLEAQLIEIKSLKSRVSRLERHEIAIDVIAEALAKHAPEVAARLLERIKE